MSVARPKSEIKKGITYVLIAAFFNTIMIVFVKLAAGTQSTTVILFARYLITLIIILPFIYYNPAQEPFLKYVKTNRVSLHLFRDICGVISLFLYFYTTKLSSLANATILFNTIPLFVPIIAYFWGGLKIFHRLWWGMGLGFFGVILILHPSTHSLFNKVNIFGLLSGFFAALVFVGSRYLTYTEPPLKNMFYYFLIGTLVTAILVWLSQSSVQLSIETSLLLLGVGIFGYLYQLFFTLSAKYAPVRLTSSFMYAAVVFSLFFDWAIWHSIPTLLTLIGIICVICGAFLMLILYPKDDYQKK